LTNSAGSGEISKKFFLYLYLKLCN
jgi:hypothetical protein